MSISDAEYKAWLIGSKGKPVVTVEFSSFDGGGSPIMLRAATARYRTTNNIYRSRLVDFVITTKLAPGVAGYSEIGWGDLKIVNPDGRLDDWRSYRHGTVEIKRGDVEWDIADHRTEFKGFVYEVQGNAKELTFTLRDEQHELDELKADTDFTLTASSLPGTLAREILTSPNGPYAAADLDTAAFNQLDTDYPYNCTVTPSGRTSALALMDELLNGFPVDYGQSRGGLITVFELKNAVGSSSHRKIKPIAAPRIKRVAPWGEVTVANGATYESTTERATIKSDYPNYKTETYEVVVDTQANADLLAGKVLDLHDEPRDIVTVKTRDAIHLMNLGDEVEVEWSRMGYESGQFGIIQKIVRRHSSYSELEVRV